MKILAVADVVCPQLLERTEEQLFVSEVDLILSCGDLPPEYLSNLRGQYAVPLLYVLGNHDLRYQQSPPLGCTAAHRQLQVIGGLKIIGFSGSRWYNGGENQFSEGQMRGFIRRMFFQLLFTRCVDIVLTHAPPRYIHDLEDPCHKGFRCFNRLIKRYQPKYFLHGHIHQDFQQATDRVSQFQSTRVVNCYGYTTIEI